jgi:hypothetical protein
MGVTSSGVFYQPVGWPPQVNCDSLRKDVEVNGFGLL